MMATTTGIKVIFRDADIRILAALEIAWRYAANDGAHHKDWVIDQMVRLLAKDKYEHFVQKHNEGEDGPNTYEWQEGIAP